VHTTPAFSPERKPLAVLCILAMLMLLWATMWPFNPYPPNGVTWLPDANGVRFEHSAVIFSDGPLKPATRRAAELPANDACAIELYLRPKGPDDVGNILTFSSDDNPDAVFLRQWRQSLLIDRSRPAHASGRKLVEFDVDDTLHAGQVALLTISSGPQGLTVYVDGKVVAGTAHFRISRDELYRQIVLGNSPSNFEVWHGEVRGLAIYDEEISPTEAAAHFVEWSTTPPASQPVDTSHVLARYDFRERSGTTIRGDVASAPPLTIPTHFSIPRKARLDSPINEFEWTTSWRRDVIENILGFMPFGFVLCGFFALSRPRGQAILIATLCGGFFSFLIEFTQYYIPRRDSSWTDVISNTTGTLLGALIAHPEWVRFALRLVFLIPPKRNTEASRT